MQIIAEAAKNILIDENLSEAQRERALNSIHDLVKALKKNAPTDKEISTAHEIYEKLGYKIGNFVTVYDSPILGVITEYNTSKGFYNGERYPIIVKFPYGTFEYSILVSKYDEVEKYKDNPEKILSDWKDDIVTHVVSDIDQDTAEKVMATQDLIDKMTEEELTKYSQSDSFANEKLPYVKEDVIRKLEYFRREAENKIVTEKGKEIDAMNLDDLVAYFESEKFEKDSEIPRIKEYVYDRLRKKFNILAGNVLLEYYDKKNYGEKTKAIMREILETK